VRVALFCHSLLSDWNHGNAHFLRGIVTELAERGHEVRVFEPRNAWSAENLVRDQGRAALELAPRTYPAVHPQRYDPATLDLDAALAGVDLVLVHEWSEPELVRRVGDWRRRTRAVALFHDTHHRSVTDPAAMARYDLSAYDGVLAFGEAVREVYARRGWGSRAFVWHEAADVRVFRPKKCARPIGDLVWVGNFGDDERTSELLELLVEPARALGLRARVYGVRYPERALAILARSGIDFAGWIPNFVVPDVFAGFRVTVHVPRRPYARRLPGIPTIRVFEALACGIPLVSGPWRDSEGLFTEGADYLVARDGREMRAHLAMLLSDPAARTDLAHHGRATILARHTCMHRVSELLSIARGLGASVDAHRPDARTGQEATA
jgi:spore maturation protein CgeB